MYSSMFVGTAQCLCVACVRLCVCVCVRVCVHVCVWDGDTGGIDSRDCLVLLSAGWRSRAEGMQLMPDLPPPGTLRT